MVGIYKITSPSGKVYIGQSINILNRFNQYKSLSQTKGQKKLNYSFKKYGIDKHIFDIIEQCSIDLLNERERYWQDYYDVLNNGLNCILTDTNYSVKVFSKETIDKIRKGNQGKEIPDSVRSQTSITMKSKGIKPKDKMYGFDNPKSIKISSLNILTNESYILNLSDTAKFFKVDRELISNRINNTTKSFRKLKDWKFERV